MYSKYYSQQHSLFCSDKGFRYAMKRRLRVDLFSEQNVESWPDTAVRKLTMHLTNSTYMRNNADMARWVGVETNLFHLFAVYVVIVLSK